MMRIAVAGTGHMALDVGAALAAAGLDVTFVGRSDERLADLERRVRRRLRATAPSSERSPGPVSYGLLGSRALEVDALLELTREDVPTKREILDALSPHLPPEALRLTGSSSILPSALGPGVVGFHPFQPQELTRLVEIVWPTPFPEASADRVRDLARTAGWRAIEEDEDRAFAVNRLLLPVQALAVQAVLDGWDPEAVDAATRSDLLPAGQLTMLDTIGLDVVLYAVRAYLDRSDPVAARSLAPLAAGVHALVAEGRRGRKGRSGFLRTCRQAVTTDLLSPDDLSLALHALFGWEGNLPAPPDVPPTVSPDTSPGAPGAARG